MSKQKKPRLSRDYYKIALAGFVAGVIWLVGLRFVLYSPDYTHYHANFHVVINGERELFDGFAFYEEVQACAATEDNPKARLHLHQPDNDVVHVHAPGTTWGNLFENVGLTLGDELIQTTAGIHVDDEANDLTFILNGNKTRTIANTVIRSEDKLLIAYDKAGVDVSQHYEQIPSNAGQFNEEDDPGSCSGSESKDIWERLKYSIGL